MRHGTLRTTVAAGALAAAMLTGCAPAAEPPVPAPATSTAPTAQERVAALVSQAVEPEWSLDVESLGREAIEVDGVVLLYTQSDEGPALRALDAETGQFLWYRPATTGASATDRSWIPVVTRDGAGTALTLVVGEADRQPDGNWAHSLDLYDVHTGQVVASLDPAWVSNVEQCDLDICLRVWTPENDGTWHDARLNADEARLDFDDDSDGRWAVTDNVTLDTANGYLAWDVDGAEEWRTTLADLLPEGTSSADFSDGFRAKFSVDDRYDPTIVVIDYETGGDEPHSAMVALATDDGRPLWHRDDVTLCNMGVSILCARDSSAQADEGAAESTDAVASPTPRTFTGLDVATGASTWEVEINGNPQTLGDGASTLIPGFLAVEDDGTDMLIDEQTGEVIPIPGDAVFGCGNDTTWMGNKNAKPLDDWVEFTGGVVFEPCSIDGDPVDRPLSRAAVMWASGAAWRDGAEYDTPWSTGRPAADPLDGAPARYYALLPGKIAAYAF